MKYGWYPRLLEVIEKSGVSARKLSQEAGLGPNYISQMKTNGKSVSADNLYSILEGFSDADRTYVLVGLSLDEQALAMLDQFTKLSEASQESFRQFLLSLRAETSG